MCLWYNAIKVPLSFPLVTKIQSSVPNYCLYCAYPCVPCRSAVDVVPRGPRTGTRPRVSHELHTDPEPLTEKDCVVITPHVQSPRRVWHAVDARRLPLRAVRLSIHFLIWHANECR